MTADSVVRLHETLRRRETPETVAALVREAIPELARNPTLGRVIAASMKRYFGWSSMATGFRQPDSATRQLAKARELALLFLGSALPEGDDPEALDAVAEDLSRLIGRTPGRGSFRHDRLDRATRRAVGLELSRRRYGKLFRLAGRLERKAARIREEQAKLELVLVSKAALAPRLSLDDLSGHAPTAAFVAYFAARMKLRSEFTIDGQQRPFDALSADLLKLCEGDPETRWRAIAHVFPREDVLARLTDAERGELLGRWFDILQLLADRLDALQRRSAMNLDTMIVKRGDDSSTWNTMAGAWNRARDHWIALIHALDLDGLLDVMLPGKVMRLMAADVAAWHRHAGGGLHPDTRMWLALPRPWAVLRGEVQCTRAMVEVAARRADIDPAKSGWTAARPRTAIAAFRPTPELVHGVPVSNPYLAAYLREIGAFSGKSVKSKSLPD